MDTNKLLLAIIRRLDVLIQVNRPYYAPSEDEFIEEVVIKEIVKPLPWYKGYLTNARLCY